MATKVPIPKLGQSEETVTIESWRVKEGDDIKKGDILFEVETDKAVLEVESQFEGKLLKIVVPAGKEVPVMTIGAIIGEEGEEIPVIEEIAPPAPKKEAKAAPAPAAKTFKAEKAGSEPRAEELKIEPSSSREAPPVGRSPNPSPRAKKFAADYLIDLSKVAGTGGEAGRVTEKDVKEYLETSDYLKKKITPAAFNIARKEKLELLSIEGSGDHGRVTMADVKDAVFEKPEEMSTIRKIIAQRLQQSKQTIPHFYVTVSIDMDAVMQKRKLLKSDDINISVNVFVVKAVADALREMPIVNASSDGKVIRRHSKVNVGVAVSVDNGLVVPVIRNTDKKAMDEIHAEVAELADKARRGKLAPEEMQGGTFTISNMGMLNVENFMAIVNPGESAILAVSSAMPTPVVIDGEIAVRNMMKVTLSCDHRIIDGSVGAEFVNLFKNKMEDPAFWDSQL